MKKSLFALLISACALAACGGGGGSDGSSGPDSQPDGSTSTEVISSTTARFEKTTLEFGEVPIGSGKVTTVVLHNDGTVEADFHLMDGLPTGFTITGCSSVPAGGTCELKVIFAPRTKGVIASTNVAPTRADVISNRLSVSGSGVIACLPHLDICS